VYFFKNKNDTALQISLSQSIYIFDLFLGLKRNIHLHIYLQILYNTYIIKLNVSKIIFENQHKVIETRALAASYSKKMNISA
jgi:hypothetical protein